MVTVVNALCVTHTLEQAQTVKDLFDPLLISNDFVDFKPVFVGEYHNNDFEASMLFRLKEEEKADEYIAMFQDYFMNVEDRTQFKKILIEKKMNNTVEEVFRWEES